MMGETVEKTADYCRLRQTPAFKPVEIKGGAGLPAIVLIQLQIN